MVAIGVWGLVAQAAASLPLAVFLRINLALLPGRPARDHGLCGDRGVERLEPSPGPHPLEGPGTVIREVNAAEAAGRS